MFISCTGVLVCDIPDVLSCTGVLVCDIPDVYILYWCAGV
jgi:hypothetical protein